MLSQKTCTKCGESKPTTEFHKRTLSRDGLAPKCKGCNSVANAKWVTANPEKSKAYKDKYHAANREKVNARRVTRRAENPGEARVREAKYYSENTAMAKVANAKYRAANRDKVKISNAAYSAANPDIGRSNDANRRSRKANATPGWSGEFDDFVLRESFSLARRRAITIGGRWHVDHVVPIAGRLVCGLHVGLNLQVIPARVNFSKGANFNPMTHSEVRTSVFVGV